MFGSKRRLAELIERLRPDLGPESLGVGPDFPGVTPKPLLSGETRRRTSELGVGVLALGTLVDGREVSSDGSPCVVLMLDVETRDGMSFTSGRPGILRCFT